MKRDYEARSEGGKGGEAPEERHRRPGGQLQGRAQNTTESRPERRRKENWEGGMRGARSKRNKGEVGNWGRREHTWTAAARRRGSSSAVEDEEEEGKMDPKLAAASSGKWAPLQQAKFLKSAHLS